MNELNEEFLAKLVEILKLTEMPYMLTGSYGSTFYGDPRPTNDIDIIIDPNQEQLQRFLSLCPYEWVYFEEAVNEAMRRRGMFNLINTSTGEKADFILRKNMEFSKIEFSRRREMDVNGVRLFILSPEDVIVSKLNWARKGESERQFRDAVSVAKTQGAHLDFAYIQTWCESLGLLVLHEKLLQAIGKSKA